MKKIFALCLILFPILLQAEEYYCFGNVCDKHKIIFQISDINDEEAYRTDWLQGLNRIRAKSASIFDGTKEVVVAIVDTGITNTHYDLVNVIKTGLGFGYVNGIQIEPVDDNGHGTHVAGIIAADQTNQKGTAGLYKHTKVYGVKSFNSKGSGDLMDIANGLEHILATGADIVNCSWGTTYKSNIIEAQIKKLIDAGITVVAAAGNNGADTDINPYYPCGFPGVICVGSVDWSGNNRSYFSNYGSAVKIYATGDLYLSTYFDGGFAILSGTSMASPVIAGAIAKGLGTGANKDTVIDAMLNSTNVLTTGFQVLDLYNMMAIIRNKPQTRFKRDPYIFDIIRISSVKSTYKMVGKIYWRNTGKGLAFRDVLVYHKAKLINKIQSNIRGRLRYISKKRLDGFYFKYCSDIPSTRCAKSIPIDNEGELIVTNGH